MTSVLRRVKNSVAMSDLRRAVAKEAYVYIVSPKFGTFVKHKLSSLVTKDVVGRPSQSFGYTVAIILNQDRSYREDGFLSSYTDSNCKSVLDANCRLNGYNDYFMFDRLHDAVRYANGKRK